MWILQHVVPGFGDTAKEEQLGRGDLSEDGKLEFEGEGGQVAKTTLGGVQVHQWDRWLLGSR